MTRDPAPRTRPGLEHVLDQLAHRAARDPGFTSPAQVQGHQDASPARGEAVKPEKGANTVEEQHPPKTTRRIIIETTDDATADSIINLLRHVPNATVSMALDQERTNEGAA